MRMEDRARKEALKVVLPYILMLLAPIYRYCIILLWAAGGRAGK